MYYSADQSEFTITDRAQQADKPYNRQMRRHRWRFIGFAVACCCLLAGIWWWHGIVQQSVSRTKKDTQVVTAQVAPTPQVAGATFGDLLKQKRNFQGWLAGVDKGSVAVVNPASGETNVILAAENPWHGPISTLVWSPNHAQLAFLIMPEEEAKGFSLNPVSQAKALGLSEVTEPLAFPYGQVVVVDVATKEVLRTGITIRNTPKSIVWLDDNRLAMIASGLVSYSLKERKTEPMAAAGVTSNEFQLQSPLVWSGTTETLYYTKIRNLGNQSSRVLAKLTMPTGAVQELGVMRTGTFNDVATSQGIDLALSDDGSRLGMLSDEGLSYMTISDGSLHRLPERSEWLWMKESILADLQWLSPSRLSFSSLGSDEARVWGVWDLPATKIHSFGKGAEFASWDNASSRLAIAQDNESKIGLLTPNWEKTADSSLEWLSLAWQNLAW